MRLKYIFPFCILCAMGCSSIGPAKMPASRMDYNIAIANSTNEEMLLNIVRLRFFEQPLFLQVGSVASSFNFGLTAQVAATIPDQRDFFNKVYSTYTPTITGQYTDAPTVTYTPYQGNSYIQQFLAEMDFDRMRVLFRSGWDFKYLLQVMVVRIGNLYHDFDERTGFIPEQHEKFMQLSELMGKIDDRGDLDVITVASGKDKLNTTLLLLRFNDEVEVEMFNNLLGISVRPQKDQHGKMYCKLRLVQMGFSVMDDETMKDVTMLPIQMRNCMRAMFFLAQGVEVPKNVQDKKQSYDLHQLFVGLFTINASSFRPSNAFVAVKHDGYWYSIDKSDIRSKMIFLVMLNIFALQSADPPKNAPVLTLPVGAQ